MVSFRSRRIPIQLEVHMIEVQCSFRTDAFEGSITIKIRPDATIGNLKHYLLEGIKARLALAAHFDMEYFRSLFFVQVSGNAEELLVWNASDDYGRITQQTDFLDSLQEEDLEQDDFSVKTKRKCSLSCFTQRELTAEVQRRREMFSIGRIRTPSPDICPRPRPPGVLRGMTLDDMLNELQERWQPIPETLQQWRENLNDKNTCAYHQFLRIDNRMKALMEQSETYVYTCACCIAPNMAAQIAKKSRKLKNMTIARGSACANGSRQQSDDDDCDTWGP